VRVAVVRVRVALTAVVVVPAAAARAVLLAGHLRHDAGASSDCGTVQHSPKIDAAAGPPEALSAPGRPHTAMDAEPRFAVSADGTPIAWTSSGAGAPAIVLTDGIGCAGYIWRGLAPDLARRWRVLHWNYRGHGQSGRPHDPSRIGIEECVDDLFAVMDSAGEERAVLAGHSMGVQVVLEAHRREPRRVAGLVLACGSYGRPLDTFHDSGAMSWLFPRLKDAVLAFPTVARIAFKAVVPTRIAFEIGLLEVNRHLLPPGDLRRYLSDLAGVDPEVFVRMMASAAAHDAAPHLPHVDVPTLIIAGERDTFTPMWLSQRMRDAIPDAEMLVLRLGTHTGLLEHAELVSLRTEKFLVERVVPRLAAPGAPSRVA
jgi:pimeloyl-ACP methyl ester carboxylesterase